MKYDEATLDALEELVQARRRATKWTSDAVVLRQVLKTHKYFENLPYLPCLNKH